MKRKLQDQLELIEKSTNWISKSLEGGKQKQALHNMVNCRRKLKKKKFALEGNPAAAMYGESQVGKSYLISSLLSGEGKPFSITDDKGTEYNYIEQINPPGGGSESTSLVSRFSVSYKPINPKFPIKAILLSPADIVLVLADSFYNDIKTSHEFALNDSQINTELDKLKLKYIGSGIEQSYIEGDDILDMQDYFENNFSLKSGNVLSSRFFDEISNLILQIRPSEWKDVFSLLWNRNKKITELFSTLIAEYEKLKFSNTIYLSIESVLYRYGTLLDVKRLKEIYNKPDGQEPEYQPNTTILQIQDGRETEISFAKSYLCALSAELVFSQPESLLESKSFLKETDLLDFPGARSRLQLPEKLIETETIPELLLRGKVAYLFNKYSESEKINILLFCAKHEQPAQRFMPEILDKWISENVGNSPKKREQFVSKSKVPPLFIVGTFFNVNLQYNPLLDKPGENSPLNYRWNQRFKDTMEGQLLNTEVYTWFNQWTSSQPYFNNIFLLRDFEKSDSISHIYNGYNEHKKELEEVIPPNYPNFREKLRQSFVENEFVVKHFEDPEKSWDEAAALNSDGTLLIIEKLTTTSNNINDARKEKIQNELNDISLTIINELKRYFHDGDKDAELDKAKSLAGDIQFRLDTAFRADGIKLFGRMMQEFMLDEVSVSKLYREKIDNIERREFVNMDIYSTYRMTVPVVENDTADKYFERLCNHYEKNTDKLRTKFKEELEKRGVNLEELLEGNNDRIKNFSLQLAESLLDFWYIHINQHNKSTIQQIFSDDIQEITEMFKKLFQKLQIDKKIAESIRHYVDGNSKLDSIYEMIADISTEILNKCIINIGFDFYSQSDISDLKTANEKNKLGIVLDSDKEIQDDNIEDIFTKIDNLPSLVQNNPNIIKTLPSYHNYIKWYNRLKIGFVSVCDIPNYDVQANNKLGTIISEFDTINY